jgi:hypothetical protein
LHPCIIFTGRCILKPVNRTVVAIFFAAVFLVFLTPMELGGFWWHLSTGQWILEHGGIPKEDPFTITAVEGLDISFVLSAFWLCQSVYAALHGLFGLWGIIALKALTFSLVFFAITRLNGGSLLAYIAVLPAVYIATFYDESRPQTFSFLFFVLTLCLLERGRSAYKEERKTPRSLFALPGLMLVWANVHPGFVIGDVLVGAYLVEAIITRRRRAMGFVLLGAFSLAISALNPNGLEAVVLTTRMLETSIAGAPAIHEHLSAREFAEFTGQRSFYPALIALIAAGFASFAPRWRRPDVLHLLVFTALAYLSVKTFRVGVFFAIAGATIIGQNLSGLRTPGALRKPLAKWFAAVALMAAIFFLLAPRTIFKKPLTGEGIFPDKAAAFMKLKALPPNIYHPYEWGGYLIWRLYPEYRVFIDSRGVVPTTEYKTVLDARPGWEGILDSYGVNTVLYWPLLPYRGNVPPIVFELQKDRGWSPVYWDTRSVIFVRSELAQSPISKDAVWEVLTALISANIARDPDISSNYTSLGEVYAERGLRPLAVEAFRKALALDPGDRRAAHQLLKIE